jgi:hypothetical protein
MTAAICAANRKRSDHVSSQPCAIPRHERRRKQSLTWIHWQPKCRGAAMGTHVAATYPRGYDFPISTLFWGAVMVIALFVSCRLAWKAIGWVRNRRRSDGVVVEVRLQDPEDPGDPREKRDFKTAGRPLRFLRLLRRRIGRVREHDPARAGGTLLDLCPAQGTQSHEATPEGA